MSAVGKIERERNDPAAGGFYTVREAARLLNIHNSGVITHWLKLEGKMPAVIRRQYQPIGRAQELGFLDLIEVRFVEHFRKRGYSLQSLRKAAEVARAALRTEHPFALYGASFIAERKNIFLRVATEIRDSKLLNLVTKQYAMYDVLEEVLQRGVTFDPTSGLAVRWYPKPAEYKHIVIDPTIAFGQPALDESRVASDAIFAAWEAEGGNFSAVADWFDISEALVQEAVDFELTLPS
jgi:uncharacterized protein (DUF433 family)